ncbi:MAG: ATP-dependent zinc protease [Chromatiales bacterium]|jgi:hypothetical protein|nr:ATP-dependent zinc protease [Chromatiales bacterium]
MAVARLLLPALLAALCLGLDPLPASAAQRDPQVILGRLEWITVRPGDRPQKARIDTGAGLTSIDARGLKVEPAADGQPERATFRLRGQRKGTPSITADVVGWVEIKGKGTKRMIRRPVIAMQLCIGNRWLDARVNLADRSGFLYPLLIGRDTLIAGNFLVDPAALYLEPARCE